MVIKAYLLYAKMSGCILCGRCCGIYNEPFYPFQSVYILSMLLSLRNVDKFVYKINMKVLESYIFNTGWLTVLWITPFCII